MNSYRCLSRPVPDEGAYAVRTVQPDDIEPIRLWRNAQMDVLRQKKPISAAEQQAYYAQHIWPTLQEAQPRNILVGYTRQGQLIGYGGLVHVDWEFRRAEVSFLLDPRRTQDPGAYAAEFGGFLRLMKALAFDVLGFNRLFTETYAIRTHHISVLEASGFRLEGVLREHVLIQDTPVDSLFHGCLSSYER